MFDYRVLLFLAVCVVERWIGLSINNLGLVRFVKNLTYFMFVLF